MRLGFEQVSEPEWEPEGKPAEETATRKILRILAITIPVIAIYIAGRFVLPPMYPTITNCGPPYTHSYGTCATDNRGWDILVPLGLLLWIPLLVASLISLRPFFNSSIADRETAVRFGKDNLIYSLRRVSEVSPSDNWRVKRRISRLTQPDDATLPHSV